MKKKFLFILFFLFLWAESSFAKSIEHEREKFLSIRSDKVNMRTGPSPRYDVMYIYIKKNTPFKILDSFEEWYKVEDLDGEHGWIKKNLFLNSKRQRYGAVINHDGIFCNQSPSNASKKKIKIDYLHFVKLNDCKNQFWCLVQIDETKAWCEKKFLWGT